MRRIDVNLRAVELGDVPWVEARKWRNQYEVWKWCRQHTHISEDDHNAWRMRIAGDPTIKMFGVYNAGPTRSTNIAVGVCGLTSINRVNQTAEFSLYIAPQHQGKGYGRAALVNLLYHGFFDHNLNRIWGETFDGNSARDMFTELGMSQEGRLRQAYYRDGQFIDAMIVSILRSEFVARYTPNKVVWA